jgi:hypothetical protein
VLSFAALESARSSQDDDDDDEEEEEEQQVRAEMEQMEIEDAPLNSNNNDNVAAAAKTTSRFRFRFRAARFLFTWRLASVTTAVSSLLSRASTALPPPWSLFQRCWVPLSSRLSVLAPIFVMFLMAAVYYMAVSSLIPLEKENAGGIGSDQLANPEAVRSYVQGRVDGDRMRRVLQRITGYDHVAGTQGGYALARYVQAHFDDARIQDIEAKESVFFWQIPSRYIHCAQNDGVGFADSVI